MTQPTEYYNGFRLIETTAITKQIQRRTHRKRRINKKWLKKYGYKGVLDDEKIILDYINPEIRNELRKSQRIIMVETILENIKESYYVDMQIVDKIPVDWTKIGLKSWDDVVLNK